MKETTAAIKQVYLKSKAALCVGLSVMTALAPSMTYALDVEVQRSINLRTSSEESSVLQKVGRLAAGSVVSIPDQYAVRKNGSVDFELTLNNWLAKASSLANDAGMKSFTDTKKDFFFPVKVVKAAPGSELGNQDSYMIALKYLQRKGALLETTQSADLMNDIVSEQSAESEVASTVAGPINGTAFGPPAIVAPIINSSLEGLEAAAVSTCNECQSRDQSLHPLAARLQSTLDSRLRKPLQNMSKRTVGHTETAASRFERTCRMRIEDFVSSLRAEISRSPLRTTVPTALNSSMMLSLMTQETTGDCNALGDGKKSAGLFQVNTKSSGFSRDQLRHPVTNARAALSNLEAKQKALANDFDFSKMTEDDRLRLLVSAYNGGEKWVSRAKDDLLQFNRQQGASLNPHSWEDLRIFYFRRHLNSSDERQVFGTVRGREQRSVKNALNNLAYTENLIPRAQGTQGSTLQDAWHRRVNG